MFNCVRKIVSKPRRRHVEGDYDLDLTYITSKIIATQYPSDGIEGFYRNRVEDVSSSI
jgi:phosphatidylinositol-3,4,5-trisphosphate 3-phosphatase/dual-specificity protein phosphatase PTEN